MTVAAELCAACGGISIEPRGFCPRCGGRDVGPGVISGEGLIWSVTRIHRPPASDGATDPYNVALIALSAGPRLMAHVPDDAAIGDPVCVTRDRIDSPDTDVIFRKF